MMVLPWLMRVHSFENRFVLTVKISSFISKRKNEKKREEYFIWFGVVWFRIVIVDDSGHFAYVCVLFIVRFFFISLSFLSLHGWRIKFAKQQQIARTNGNIILSVESVAMHTLHWQMMQLMIMPGNGKWCWHWWWCCVCISFRCINRGSSVFVLSPYAQHTHTLTHNIHCAEWMRAHLPILLLHAF